MYTVRWAAASHEYDQTIGGTARLIRQGEPIGFRTDESGAVIALTGSEQIVLRKQPRRARTFAWYYRVKEPSALAKNAEEFFEQLGTVAKVVGIGALIAGAIYFGWDLESDDHHRHHHHDDDWGMD
jgi:hypothetical protein